MTDFAPTPKDGLREALDHDDARADAAYKRKYSNLARCYLDLIAQRDAAMAERDAAEAERDKALRELRVMSLSYIEASDDAKAAEARALAAEGENARLSGQVAMLKLARRPLYSRRMLIGERDALKDEIAALRDRFTTAHEMGRREGAEAMREAAAQAAFDVASDLMACGQYADGFLDASTIAGRAIRSLPVPETQETGDV